jgi:hypothetical protein
MEPTASTSKDEDHRKSVSQKYKYIDWGKSDKYQMDIYKDVEMSTLVAPKLKEIAAMYYGHGITTGKIEIVDGHRTFVPYIHPQFEEFCRLSGYMTTFAEICKQAAWWGLPFIEMNFSKDGSKILKVECLSSMMYRYQQPDTPDDRPSHVVFNPDFGNNPDHNRTISLPLIDTWYDPVSNTAEAMSKADAVKKRIYAQNFGGFGPTRLYPILEWHTAVKSGWIKLQGKLKTYKEAITDNQTADQGIWYFHPDFWKENIAGYDKLDSTEKKIKARDEYLTRLNSFYSNPANKGKNLGATMKMHPNGREMMYTMEFKEFKSPYTEGMYVEDMQETDEQIMNSMNYDKAIGSTRRGGGMGNSGGSDKRVGYNIQMAGYKVIRDTLLNHLKFINDYNQWGDDWVFRIQSVEINTADQKEEVSNQIENQ